MEVKLEVNDDVLLCKDIVCVRAIGSLYVCCDDVGKLVVFDSSKV